MRARLVVTLTLFLVLPASVTKASKSLLLVNYNVTKGVTVVPTQGNLKLVPEDLTLEKIGDCTTTDCVNGFKDQLIRAVPVVNGSFRWIATQGDTLDVVVLYVGDLPKIGFEEKPRSSILEQQIGVVLGGVFGTEVTTKFAPPPFKIAQEVYVLTKVRATLTVTIGTGTKSVKPPPPPSPAAAEVSVADAAPPAKTGTAKDTTTITVVLMTGPTERAFLSADTVFNKISEKTWNKTTQKIQVRDAANHPYAGLNLALNDIIASSWNPYVKAMVSIQSKPLDSWGVAGGLKLPSTMLGSFNLNTIAPFVGATWDRSSAKQPSGAFVDGHRYKAHVRAGVSLDVAGIAKAIKGGAGASTTAAAKPKAS